MGYGFKPLWHACVRACARARERDRQTVKRERERENERLKFQHFNITIQRPHVLFQKINTMMLDIEDT